MNVMNKIHSIGVFVFLIASPILAAELNCRAIEDNNERLACYDQQADAAMLLVEQNAAQQAEQQFGKNKRDNEIESIKTRIVGEFKGWSAKSKFTFENGQVWQVSDGSSGAYFMQSPVVTIESGMFGSFFLRIEGANKSPRIKRIK